MKGISNRLKWITTIGAIALLVLALIPHVKLNWIHVALLVVALFPWYLHAIRTLKVGGTEVEFDRAQDTTDQLPPAPSAPSTPAQPTSAPAGDPLADPNARRILATLWRYQRQHFANDDTRRWTFTVHPFAPAYPDFVTGLALLLRRGLAVVAPENNHCMLSNEGLAFCRQHATELEAEQDMYRF